LWRRPTGERREEGEKKRERRGEEGKGDGLFQRE
jgi:hypothetical protein